jgi:hypothetical protein
MRFLRAIEPEKSGKKRWCAGFSGNCRQDNGYAERLNRKGRKGTPVSAEEIGASTSTCRTLRTGSNVLSMHYKVFLRVHLSPDPSPTGGEGSR